jgi:hypothetical protein
MSGWTAERWAASTGVGYAVVTVVGYSVVGEPADYNASAAELGSYFDDKHAELTIQTLCGGLSLVLFLWFVSSLAGMFRGAGQRRLSSVMSGAGVAVVAVLAVADSVMIAAVQLAPVLDGSSVTALFGFSWFVYHRVFWLVAAMALAVALATLRSGALPRWYAWLSLAGVVVFLIGAISVRQYGFLSPSGEGGYVAYLVFAFWILVSSVLLVRKLGADAPA